ncbi:MAG: hypothetical protein K2L24_03675 [Opitutales bacterium]|nr:hypothetical protein [Opitutales bacterium]
MNCKIVKSLSLAGMILATSFAFGEISPETEVWIQELIENAKQSPKGAAFLTEIMSLMERYAALPQRLANPDALTLADAGFLPKFFNSLGHPLVPEQIPEILHAMKERYPVEVTDTGTDDTTPEGGHDGNQAPRKNGNIWVRGKIIEIQGTGVHRTTLQETIRNVGEYLVWRLDPDASDATLPHNPFVDELRGRKPDIEWIQKLIAVAKEHLLKVDPTAVIDDPSAGVSTENPAVDKPTDPETAVTSDIRREQIVSPEALQAAKLKNRKLQVLVGESTRCWKAMHEAYVKAAQDKLADYMTAHPDNTLHSLQTQLEQWYSESTHNRSEAEKALAAMEKKLAEQQVIMNAIETRMKEYKYFINVWLSEFKRRETMIRRDDTPEDTVEAFSHDNPIENYTE